MSHPARSDSMESGESIRQAIDVVIKLLDLSINFKTNLMRCIIEDGAVESEDRVVFCSVYDYLHHSEWRVAVSNDVKDTQLRVVERIRGNPTIVSAVIEACKGSILKEVDVIHTLNCELFFTKSDAASLTLTPAYFYFNKADDFHKAIVDNNFANAADLPEKLKDEMEKHIKTRTLWARRTSDKAKVEVKAVLHYDAMPKEIITFHSKII